jgi:hypothetical protein
MVDYVRDGSEKVPVPLGYGQDVAISAISYDPSRVTLSANYAIVQSDDKKDGTRRQIEFGLSSTQGWDVQIQARTQTGDESSSTGWSSFVGQAPPSTPGAEAPKRLVLRFVHAPIEAGEELVRIRVTIEQTATTTSGVGCVRINGVPTPVEQMEHTTPLRNLLDGSPGASAMSLTTVDTADRSITSCDGSISARKKSLKQKHSSSERGISSLIKRNYICKLIEARSYLTTDFTSLLQEPEPKWRPVAESKGVSVHQLDSIDRTLVVFRAEAVFVGVGVWDLFSTIITPGTRVVWDKAYDDATLLEDVNELTDVWHFKSKASWPVSARDSVLVRTTYKSPSSVHIFGFSTEDSDLFPVIPPVIDPNVIRTQIDLQGWSIEALSPNTTQVTLLEQSHPGGWSNKSSIPQVMMTTLAGLGEFAIKHGAPPVTTRLHGAKAVASRYDVEKETFRFEYVVAKARRSKSSSTATAFPFSEPPPSVNDDTAEDDSISEVTSKTSTSTVDTIDCGLRCDPDKWSGSIIVLVDPPPKTISALKRHQLSPNGGGLWLAFEHDAATLGHDSVTVTVRRGTQTVTTKTSLTVNGTKVKIDTEELSETDVQQLKKQRRSKPSRVALDQPPVIGALRKRQSNASMRSSTTQNGDPYATITASNAFSRLYTPLAKLYSSAAESTRGIVPMGMGAPTPAPAAGSTPVDAAVHALRQLARIHADRDGESTDPFGWQPVTDRDGLKVERKIVAHVSDSFPLFRAGRIIEGFTAEEVSSSVSAMREDEYFGKPVRLQTYSHGITTSHFVAHTAFPFRARSAVVSTIVARQPESPPASPSANVSHAPLSTIFHASTSGFDPVTLGLDAAKYNPSVMPACNVLLEGWILETIDPYSHEQYAIPSTRCMYVAAVDYGGNIPVSVNNMLNSGLPRALLNMETSLKKDGAPSRARWPPMSVLSPDPHSQGPWSIEGNETYKVPVDEINDGDDYVMTVTVQPPSVSTSKDAEALRPPLLSPDSRTSSHSARSYMIDLAEDIRRGRRNLIVADIDVGAEFVKGGCEIAIRAVSLPEAYHGEGRDTSVLPLDLAGGKLGMPFKCNVISLAPSVLQSASLDPQSSTRHLLRVTLPTAGYEAPVNDPLTGKSALLPRPRWLLDLINDGALIQIRLVARRAEPALYMFEGAHVPVEDECKLPTRQLALTKEPAKLRPPQLVTRSTPKSVSLEKPLAIARQYLPDAPPEAADADADSDVNSEVTKTPTNEPADLPPMTQAEQPLEVKALAPPTPTSRYNIFAFGPLTRFSASLPASKEGSPSKLTAPLPLEPAAKSKASSAANTAVPTESKEDTAVAAPRQSFLARTAVPLPAAIILCIVCLLLGSLIRSLLTEADFVIYSLPGTVSPEGETWRELRRIGEWRAGRNRDLIIAFAHRREAI